MKGVPLSDRSTEKVPARRAEDDLPTNPDVIVAVGTDHHPFDRLVEWVDAWATKHPEISVLVQRGTSRATTKCRSVELLPHPELCETFAKSVAVVSHGGPSTVMDARMAGRLPIVMARNPEFGEHVDDHQMRFADHLKRHDLAVVIDEQQSLHNALDDALANPDNFTVPVESSAITGVVEFGRVLDRLLLTKTPIVPSTPEGVGSDTRHESAPALDEPLEAAIMSEAASGQASLERNGA